MTAREARFLAWGWFALPALLCAHTDRGLTNMRDRLEALGGSFEVRSALGAGTIVRGVVPVANRGSS